MLTGNQLAAARRLAGIATQQGLADAAGVGRATVERAEAARNGQTNLRVKQLNQIVAALENAGLEFVSTPGKSVVGGLVARPRMP